MLTLESPSIRPVRKRVPKDPTPRFRVSRELQLDVIDGCLELQLPSDHLARRVWSIVEKLDTTTVESRYSPLGRRGFHPKRLLATWVYASLVGLHHSTKLARACQTDAAFRWLCGGDRPSGPTLRRARMNNTELFEAAIERTIALAAELNLVDIEDLAIDSMRIRAHASLASVRTVDRSTKRLNQLEKVDTSSATESARDEHDARVRKHERALAECERRGVPSVSVTNDLASLMKFPSGAAAPGHRATLVASGVSNRFVVGVIVDASSSDSGKLGEQMTSVRETLDRLGLRDRTMVVAADAGYYKDVDLQFAHANRDWLDALIAERDNEKSNTGLFGRDRFVLDERHRATCPAGKEMLGPYPNDKTGDAWKWVGVGCAECPLKSQCTKGASRSLNIDFAKSRATNSMHERMAADDAKTRYNRRIATIEPVFSFMQDAMGFRRCSSRLSKTVKAEVLLKVLAYNIDRLIRALRDNERIRVAYVLVDEF
jgi:transposase